MKTLMDLRLRLQRARDSRDAHLRGSADWNAANGEIEAISMAIWRHIPVKTRPEFIRV